jgi:hypothetical protein
LEVGRGHALLNAAAAARMPLLQEAVLTANGSTKTLALAAALRAAAGCAGGGSAVGSVVSALAGLTALTRLRLTVYADDVAAPLVLPWAHIEVGAGCSPPAGLPAGAFCSRVH